MSSPWRALEAICGSAVKAEWTYKAGGKFGPLLETYLRPLKDERAKVHPCPCRPECYHRVIRHPNRIVAVCEDREFACDDFELSDADLIPYELNWKMLGRAVASAFGCEHIDSQVGIQGVRQIAAFSGFAMPLFLTIHRQPETFREAIARLVAGMPKPFVVLAPSGQWMDANCHAMLGRECGFLDLESHITLTEDGKLRSNRLGGELLSPFLPENVEPVRQSELKRITEILGKMGAKPSSKKADPVTVFNLVVIKGLSQREAAKKCRCAPSLIHLRVGEIERIFDFSLKELRSFATDLIELDSVVKGSMGRKARSYRSVERHQFGEDECDDGEGMDLDG